MNLQLAFLQIMNKCLEKIEDSIRGIFKHSKYTSNPDEVKLINRLLGRIGYRGLMIDVGAHFGGSLAIFARQYWNIYAFEPDDSNRSVLLKKFGGKKHIYISELAVSNQVENDVSFYSSSESTGISGLSSFRASHVLSQQVSTTTLTNIILEHCIGVIDFLKIDTEGFDLFVLEGFPWSQYPYPRVILCEFEDYKTERLGYTYTQLADFLESKGYKIIVSEWSPIKKYGSRHLWKRFFIYSEGSDSFIAQNAWGNLIAVYEQNLFDSLVKLTIERKW